MNSINLSTLNSTELLLLKHTIELELQERMVQKPAKVTMVAGYAPVAAITEPGVLPPGVIMEGIYPNVIAHIPMDGGLSLQITPLYGESKDSFIAFLRHEYNERAAAHTPDDYTERVEDNFGHIIIKKLVRD